MAVSSPNRLIHASSPYLLQHANNPVDWYPWGDEALEKARKENKLLIISVGYAACHWCHVMEHQSFEDQEVADLMNRYFVSIKVDREERPDVDQVYMNAAYLSTGRGGWPLNAIALPDGRPVFAGTYFPKQNWMQVLSHFAKIWAERRNELEELAVKIKEGIRAIDHEVFSNSPAEGLDKDDIRAITGNILGVIDFEKGGVDKSPKFPMPSIYRYLLESHYHSGDEKSMQAVTITLDQMKDGGIYDAAGGGFARYSTDEDWFAPHFEKMLYDNGQLVSLYADTYRVTKNPAYKKVIEETLGWVNREMTSEEGGFYSSLDADSDGEEGKFYTWSKKEIETILGEDAEWFGAYYGVTESGNWEGTNILAVQVSEEIIQKRFELSAEAFEIKKSAALEKLLMERGKRNRPGLDDKILTSWNALMLVGYLDAYKAFENVSYLRVAEKNAAFIREHLYRKEGGLFRNYKDGVASVPAFLDDYALWIEGLIALYQAGFDENYLTEARDFLQYVIEHFYHHEEEVFYYTASGTEELIVRTKEMSDNVIPASNSIMASNLLMLGSFFENEEWVAMSRKLCERILPSARRQGAYHANWGRSIINHVYGIYEISFCGKSKQDGLTFNVFMPDAIFMATDNETVIPLLDDKQGTNGIYICKDKVCQAPMDSTEKMMSWINQEKSGK